jgi:hypothetical protein
MGLKFEFQTEKCVGWDEVIATPLESGGCNAKDRLVVVVIGNLDRNGKNDDKVVRRHVCLQIEI